jgi:hypothetical protein
MDSSHFDSLIRSLTAARSRRGTMAALLGGALGLLGLSQTHSAGAGGACQPACGACQSCKKGRCHKGKHGKKRCQRGTCVATPPGTVSCGGACVDLASDPRNCGSCGTRCSVNQTCIAGSCRCTIYDVQGGRLCPIPDPNATCCAIGCACSPVSGDTIFEPATCRFISLPDCPPERHCIGPQCAACCPAGTTCDPATGRCLQ